MIDHLGTRLRAAMVKRGRKRTQLASDLGMEPCQLGRYLRGQTAPRADVLRRLCDALGVSADYLIGRAPADSASAAQ
jgi:transcriptional regulator with XRE-family HTH domain